jgi:hypothetical protein
MTVGWKGYGNVTTYRYILGEDPGKKKLKKRILVIKRRRRNRSKRRKYCQAT